MTSSTKTRSARSAAPPAPNQHEGEPGSASYENERLSTYVQFTTVLAQVPTDLHTLVQVGWLARDERISIGAYQEVLDALWLYGPVDAAVIIGGEVTPPPQVATGATEGAPGTFTPEGSVVPADLTALATVLASPATLWAEGSHVITVDTLHAYWDGTAWALGDSPVVAPPEDPSVHRHSPDAGWRKATLQEYLDLHEVSYDDDATKAELLALAIEHFNS